MEVLTRHTRHAVWSLECSKASIDFRIVSMVSQRPEAHSPNLCHC